MSGLRGTGATVKVRHALASGAAIGVSLLLNACGSSGGSDMMSMANEPGAGGTVPTTEQLLNRAYVISNESNDLFVMDLGTLTKVAQVDTSVGEGVNGNHMAMVSKDGSKIFISAPEQNTMVVLDARTLEITDRIALGNHPTHSEMCINCPPDGRDELWVVNEQGSPDLQPPQTTNPDPNAAPLPPQGSVSVIDMDTDEVVKTFTDPSLMVPHFVRFHGHTAYIPSIGGNQITVLDLDSFTVQDVLLLDGQDQPGACSGDPCGFADAQIDGSGMLVAAHIETGHVLSYDTNMGQRRPDLLAGNHPWSIFVDQMSNNFDTNLMPNWGDSTVSVIADHNKEIARSLEGDQESYGINYSPLAPGQAFVLNRVKERVAVIDRQTGSLVDAIDVGGTTETASTTRDGKYLLLPISSTNQFAVLDVSTRQEVARFDDVGQYPWSVTTIGGQNYCH
jgi:DNA-binding beta-propeller fold protein YncE